MPTDPTSDQPSRRRRPTGALSWACGLGVFLCIPIIAMVAVGLLMAMVGRYQRRHGGTAAENGRNAANWGLTMVVVSVPLLVVHFAAITLLDGTAAAEGFFPIGIAIVVLAAVAVVHVVVCVMGVLRAGDRRAFRPPAFPFYA
ncbi:hypothetical protein FXB39_17890 [Nocardioides sp. BGMRC 2183]|nr:hypothetical protein FXB39_17890 [Nocardioides sp. BGMRC 2183]